MKIFNNFVIGKNKSLFREKGGKNFFSEKKNFKKYCLTIFNLLSEQRGTLNLQNINR